MILDWSNLCSLGNDNFLNLFSAVSFTYGVVLIFGYFMPAVLLVNGFSFHFLCWSAL